jgi:acyl-CoA dehydrogenase
VSGPTTLGVDPLLVDTAERLLAAASTPDAIERAEADGWCAPVWDAMAEAGFPWISVPETAGGTGGSVADALAVLRAVGRHAAPVPMAETGVLGGWLAASAGLPVPDGPVSVVGDPGAWELDGDRLRGEATVPWARRADQVLAVVASPDGPLVLAVPNERIDVEPRTSMAGEPRDIARVDTELAAVPHAPAPSGVDQQQLALRGCLTRVVLAAGALDRLSELTVDYANARQQFGRPVATFQAVQQHLVTVAQCAVRAAMAAGVSTRALESDDPSFEDPAFEIAAARVVVDTASVEATRAAHQAHGAMGVTREYALHHYSRRLWAWRHEYGTGRSWRRALGAQVVATGADGLFPLITR